ncbi:unnamed protein product [Diplocarpon coronariae]
MALDPPGTACTLRDLTLSSHVLLPMHRRWLLTLPPGLPRRWLQTRSSLMAGLKAGALGKPTSSLLPWPLVQKVSGCDWKIRKSKTGDDVNKASRSAVKTWLQELPDAKFSSGRRVNSSVVVPHFCLSTQPPVEIWEVGMWGTLPQLLLSPSAAQGYFVNWSMNLPLAAALESPVAPQIAA